MKLFVDDIRNAPDDTWHVSRTVDAAIRAIEQFEFDEISLDHDISHQVVMGRRHAPFPCEETFQAVARFLGALHSNKENKRVTPKVYVHSSNPAGAKTIQEILNRYGIASSAALGKTANRLELEL